MRRILAFTLSVCVMVFPGCFAKKSSHDSAYEKLPKLGVVVKIPESFTALSQAQMENASLLKTTTLELEPFNVIPLYAYTDTSGKGLIIISELPFMENITPERFPMSNIYNYKKNIEDYFGSEEISSEEMGGNDISTVLLAMSFNEDGDDVFLFKGLNYIYPNRFFMIDLYVINKDITQEDAMGFINMFNSLGIY
jgi:hypothetical protein